MSIAASEHWRAGALSSPVRLSCRGYCDSNRPLSQRSGATSRNRRTSAELRGVTSLSTSHTNVPMFAPQARRIDGLPNGHQEYYFMSIVIAKRRTR